MAELLRDLNPVLQALAATGFTWGMTALGASVVFLTRDVKQRLLDAMLGFAGGVMVAASYWSLLAPAIELSQGGSVPAWVPAVVGFVSGAMVLLGIDRVLPHLHLGFPTASAEGVKTGWRRTTLLVLAITLHNIPEGMAVGVAFGATGVSGIPWTAAATLALGIGIQNLPEGLAVSVALRREKMSRRKSFRYGQLSGVVEPVAGVIAAAAAVTMRSILPYALAFAAGAMIFVVIEEVIPESQRSGNTDLATVGAIIGFALMMLLDVAFG